MLVLLRQLGFPRLELLHKWEEASFRTRFQEIEYRLKMQRKRLRLLTAQVPSVA